MDNRPIGVFDSGLGGLTAVKELEKVLPEESIVYFGDTGRVPYGNRSRETILRYARQDMAFLLDHGVKAILAACGTVSSVARSVGEGLDVPYFDVIGPTVKAAAQATKNGRIGVDTLILGCTHYPIISPTIASVMGRGVVLIDSGREAARALADTLRSMDLLSVDACRENRYFITDTLENFSGVAELFLGHSVQGHTERIDIEKF